MAQWVALTTQFQCVFPSYSLLLPLGIVFWASLPMSRQWSIALINHFQKGKSWHQVPQSLAVQWQLWGPQGHHIWFYQLYCSSNPDLMKDQCRTYQQGWLEGKCKSTLSCSCWHHPQHRTHVSQPRMAVMYFSYKHRTDKVFAHIIHGLNTQFLDHFDIGSIYCSSTLAMR